MLGAALMSRGGSALAEDRTFDGSGNHLNFTMQGAAGEQLPRLGYLRAYANPFGAMISDSTRLGARSVSNQLMAQSTSTPSSRGLSNYLWVWGQFLDHDMDLSTTSHGAATNGAAPIATGVGDPLGPNPIAFTRSNFEIDGGREQVNEVTSYIDASQVYGSSAARAAALRTGGGTGAKLVTSANNLLPYNTLGLANQNNGPTPASQLFLAGDIRANENVLLTSMQTVFMREHNRLVDAIAVQQPSLNAEQQYQLARKIVGAEIQAITYKEFLPALLGPGAPTVQGYHYTGGEDASVTNSFASAAFRFGHSTLTQTVNLADAAGNVTGSMTLGSISSSPNTLTNNPGLMNQLLSGAATQLSEEVDLKFVNAIRNVMFGPPGAGGTDLAAVDIQRARDHGLPDYNTLRDSYGLPKVTQWSQITSDTAVQNALSTAYGDIDNIDPLVGGLAEDHVAGSSLGPFLKELIRSQFVRTRDGDRLFYRGNDAGLYTNGVLNASIASLVNLNTVSLASVIEANTSITGLSGNVFYAGIAGDFNHDGTVNQTDLVVWKSAFAAGTMSGNDFMVWQRNLGSVAPWVAAAGASAASVPEPGSAALLVMASFALLRRRTKATGPAGGRRS
jgi:hypothetical protein